jgi:thioredoxin 1
MIEITSSNFASVSDSRDTVVLDFHADWCQPCKTMAPVLENLQSQHPDIVVGGVDVDREPQLVEKFSISSLPTVLVCKNGKVERKMVGISSLNELEEAVNENVLQ